MGGWLAQLNIEYTRHENRTVANFEHQGPLRLLKSLYPEGNTICHNVLVHPPSGLVGGDTLDIQIHLNDQAHALLTTPGASRFYRSEQGLATQRVHARLAEGARLEWLPLETLAYNGCDGLNQVQFELAPSSELFAWDMTALGLPHANLPFERGQLQQHMEIPGVWLERGLLNATDKRLMAGPLGLRGMRCMATLVWACGENIQRDRKDQALTIAHNLLENIPDGIYAGVTAPHGQVLVLRVIAPVVEPAQVVLRSVWSAWRQALWKVGGSSPRIWAM
jgi:urease accessory protein